MLPQKERYPIYGPPSNTFMPQRKSTSRQWYKKLARRWGPQIPRCHIAPPKKRVNFYFWIKRKRKNGKKQGVTARIGQLCRLGCLATQPIACPDNHQAWMGCLGPNPCEVAPLAPRHLYRTMPFGYVKWIKLNLNPQFYSNIGSTSAVKGSRAFRQGSPGLRRLKHLLGEEPALFRHLMPMHKGLRLALDIGTIFPARKDHHFSAQECYRREGERERDRTTVYSGLIVLLAILYYLKRVFAQVKSSKYLPFSLISHNGNLQNSTPNNNLSFPFL